MRPTPTEDRFRAFEQGRLTLEQFLDLELDVKVEPDRNNRMTLTKNNQLIEVWPDGQVGFMCSDVKKYFGALVENEQ